MTLINRAGDIQVPLPAAPLLKWWIKRPCSTQHFPISFSSIYVVRPTTDVVEKSTKRQNNQIPFKGDVFLFVCNATLIKASRHAPFTSRINFWWARLRSAKVELLHEKCQWFFIQTFRL